jgi:hypothetical protein
MLKTLLLLLFSSFAIAAPSQRPNTAPPTPIFVFVPAIGLSSLTYTDNITVNYAAIALTAQALGRFAISETWDLSASASATVATLHANGPDTARFFGYNLRAGYAVPFVDDPWRLAILAGFYYTTMSVKNDAFGFSDLLGPQIHPVLQRSFDPYFAMVYFKYAPIARQITSLSFSNSEKAIGGGFGWQLSSGRALAFTLDYTALDFTVDNVSVNTTSLTGSVAYRF